MEKTKKGAFSPDDIRNLHNQLTEGLVEREVAIRLSILAALAGEHLFLIGPPGTAKSLIARRLQLAFTESTYFERLLTRFTVPEELFGPLSIKGLEEDRYERLTESYLPTASIAFLDEIFKANSAILNALLTLLNEREFDNGTKRVKTPLIVVIGASNELPDGEELDALFDRFLLRLHLGPVSKGAFQNLLGLRGHAIPEIAEFLRFTSTDLIAVQGKAEAVEIPDDVVAILCELREWCAAEGISVSDRRWRKIVKLLQVAALTNGRQKVSVWDCWLLQHCLWSQPEDREKIYAWYASRVGASAAMDPSRLTRIVVSWEGRLTLDQNARSQMRDSRGRLIFKTPDGKLTIHAKGSVQAKRSDDPLYLAPTNALDRSTGSQISDRTKGGRGYTVNELDDMCVNQRNYYSQEYFQDWSKRDSYLANQSNWLMEDKELAAMMEPMRYKQMYIDACLREVDELRTEIEDYKAKLFAHIESLETEIRNHIWVTSDFVEPASKSLGHTRQEVDTLLARIMKLRQGFEMLPNDTDASSIIPAESLDLDDSCEQSDKDVPIIVSRERLEGEENIIISQWFVEVGDHMKEGQDLVEVETGYSEFILNAPIDGILASVEFNSGDEVSPEAPLGMITPEKAVVKKSKKRRKGR